MLRKSNNSKHRKHGRVAIVSVELLLVSVVSAFALIVAFASLRDSAISELSDMVGSIDDLNQSFIFDGATGQSAASPGSGFLDSSDSPDSPDDITAEIDNGIVFSIPGDELQPLLLSSQFEAEGPEATTTTGGPHPEGWNVWSNGQIFVQVDIPEDGTYRFSARLWGQQGGADLPNAAFLVGGVAQGNFDITQTSFADAGVYYVDVNMTAGTYPFGVAFTNDFYAPPVDRNLLVDWLLVEGPN